LFMKRIFSILNICSCIRSLISCSRSSACVIDRLLSSFPAVYNRSMYKFLCKMFMWFIWNFLFVLMRRCSSSFCSLRCLYRLVIFEVTRSIDSLSSCTMSLLKVFVV
jgi:hypothetical protein